MGMKRILSLLCFLLVCDVVFAETIKLKSGRTIEGKVVEHTADVVKVDMGIGVVTTYYLDEVERIDRESNADRTDLGKVNDIEKKEVLRTELENIYKLFFDALQSGDEQRIKKYIAAVHHETLLKNLRKFGVSSIMNDMNSYPNVNIKVIDDFQFVKTLEEDDAVVLLYINENYYVGNSDNSFEDMYAFIRFVNEDGMWKVDIAQQIPVSRSRRAEEAISTWIQSMHSSLSKAKKVAENYQNVPNEKEIEKAATDIKVTMRSALKIYELDNGRYPTTSEGLGALMNKPSSIPLSNNWNGPYLSKTPLDPWGKPYNYKSPGMHNADSYDLSSDGPDGVESSDDITNW